MKVLHLFKSEPDETVKAMVEADADNEVATIELYDGPVDWEDVVDRVFEHDKVTCWW